MVTTTVPLPRSDPNRKSSSFFRDTKDLPCYDQHGLISRHVSEKSLEAAWEARVRYHTARRRSRHSRRVLRWNGLYVLYELHLPPASPLPENLLGRVAKAAHVEGKSAQSPRSLSILNTGACERGTVLRSNGGLVSSNGRYTFIQHHNNHLAIYDAEGGVIWAPGLAASEDAANTEDNTVYTEFQHDGDLVQYAQRKGWLGRVAIWRSNSGNCKGGDTLVMQDDGNLVIYAVGKTGRDGNGRRVLPKAVWESGTGEDGGVNRIRP